MPPVVSIVVPVYNRFELVSETVSSILGQKFEDFELILVDDCSPDGTGSRLSEFNDPRIKVFHNERSLGAGATRNVGLRKATGKYVAFCDQDDLWEPDKLKLQIEVLDNNQSCAIVGSWIQEFTIEAGVSKNLVLHRLFATESENEEFLLYTTPFGTCSTVLIRKSTLDQHQLEFREDLGRSTCEDYDLWYRISKFGGLRVIPQVLVHYRIHETQESRLASQTIRDNMNIIRQQMVSERGLNLTPAEFEAIVSMGSWASEASATKLKSASTAVSKVLGRLVEQGKSPEHLKLHYNVLINHFNRSPLSTLAKLMAFTQGQLTSKASPGMKVHALHRIAKRA